MSGRMMGRMGLMGRMGGMLVLAGLAFGCAAAGTRSQLPDGASLRTDAEGSLEGLKYSSVVSNGTVRYVSLEIPKREARFAGVIDAKGRANTAMIGAYGDMADAVMVQIEKMAAAYLGLQGQLGGQQIELARIAANLEMFKAQLAAQQGAMAAQQAQITTVAAGLAAVSNAMVFSIQGAPVRWINCSLERAKIVGPFTYVKHDANDTIRWAYGDISAWPIGSNPAGCHGFFWFAVRRGSEWIGNKYDHIGDDNGTPQTVKELKNIRVGYAKDASGAPVIPVAGEQVAFGIASYNEDEVMGVALVPWQ